MRDNCEAKIWLHSLNVEYNHGFSSSELNYLLKLTESHHTELLEKWNDHFANNTHHTEPQAITVHFTENIVHITLNNGQILQLDLQQDWLQWLAKATPEQRENWSLEPRGNAVYWEDLDDGIEVCHALEAALLLAA